MSNKAAKLGASASFSHAAPAISARRAAIAAATEAATAGTPVDRPDELPLHLISENPDNPREDLGDLSDITQTLGEVGLVTAITVATIDAYLKERPGRAGDLAPGAEYVVVDGHRRLAAAREAGLETIKYVVNDGFAASDEKLLEAAYVANLHRENMTELEEAAALKKLVGFYGSQRKAAQRLGITQGFISQRLSLLELDISLQADLASGQRKVEHVRGLAKLSPEEQRRKADQRAAEAPRKPREKGGSPSAVPTPRPAEREGDYGVITQPEDDQPERGETTGDYGVITPPEAEPELPAAEPLPRAGAAAAPAGADVKPAILEGLPWTDVSGMADIILAHMKTPDVQRLSKTLWARCPS
ncbi:hypothetical protein ADL21_00720 [Streptomyces albus subsp. albus]|nr:hypothetical protein ADL21_00720 [Streptomyces albus subsp. albus]